MHSVGYCLVSMSQPDLFKQISSVNESRASRTQTPVAHFILVVLVSLLVGVGLGYCARAIFVRLGLSFARVSAIAAPSTRAPSAFSGVSVGAERSSSARLATAEIGSLAGDGHAAKQTIFLGHGGSLLTVSPSPSEKPKGPPIQYHLAPRGPAVYTPMPAVGKTGLISDDTDEHRSGVDLITQLGNAGGSRGLILAPRGLKILEPAGSEGSNPSASKLSSVAESGLPTKDVFPDEGEDGAPRNRSDLWLRAVAGSRGQELKPEGTSNPHFSKSASPGLENGRTSQVAPGLAILPPKSVLIRTEIGRTDSALPGLVVGESARSGSPNPQGSVKRSGITSPEGALALASTEVIPTGIASIQRRQVAPTEPEALAGANEGGSSGDLSQRGTSLDQPLVRATGDRRGDAPERRGFNFSEIDFSRRSTWRREPLTLTTEAKGAATSPALAVGVDDRKPGTVTVGLTAGETANPIKSEPRDPPTAGQPSARAANREVKWFGWAIALGVFVGWLDAVRRWYSASRRLSQSEYIRKTLADELAYTNREIERLNSQDWATLLDLAKVRKTVQTWLDKQGHDRCWYYPDLFKEIATALDLKPTVEPKLPTLEEFREGCRRYQAEEYGLPIVHPDGRIEINPLRHTAADVMAAMSTCELDSPRIVATIRTGERIERRYTDGTIEVSENGGLSFEKLTAVLSALQPCTCEPGLLTFASVCDPCKNSLPAGLWLKFVASDLPQRQLAAAEIARLLQKRRVGQETSGESC